MPARSINLDAEARFVPTAILRSAYISYEESRNPTAINYIPMGEGTELGIVSSAVPEIARAISSMLSCSLEDARNDRGGHLPTEVVRRVQGEIISPWGVSNLWGTTGHRFVLSQRVDEAMSELLATILVGQSKDTVFFFTGRYNNLRHSTIAETVDFQQPNAQDPSQRWFDRFVFPEIARFKPRAYHHIANFVVAREHRRKKLSRLLLDTILEKYSRDYIEAHGLEIEHSQHLLCGRGYWQIGDPPWLTRMERLGFYLRWGAESFFIEHDWAPLPPIFDDDGAKIENVDYNASFQLPERYQQGAPEPPSDEHLLERVPLVIELSQQPNAKLQYFQTMYDFLPTSPRYLAYQSSTHCATRFLTEPLTLRLPELVPGFDGLDAAVRALDLPDVQQPAGSIVATDGRSLHRADAATDAGWRLWVRLVETDREVQLSSTIINCYGTVFRLPTRT